MDVVAVFEASFEESHGLSDVTVCTYGTLKWHSYDMGDTGVI